MSNSRILVVLGATGSQGGSVITHFLDTPGWHIRALTRDPSKASAQALSAKGVELAKGDLSDPASLKAAFDGATAIFAVTDFWTLFQQPSTWAQVTPTRPVGAVAYDLELAQAKSVIDAAAEVPTLEKFIFSSLQSVRKWSKGKYMHVFHFDAKAAATEYIHSAHPDLAKKTSVLIVGLYAENHLSTPETNPFAFKKVPRPFRPNVRASSHQY